MADYRSIPNAEVDPNAPVTSELAYAWRDNPIAISEGAVGAPNLLIGVAARSAASAIGTYIFATRTSGTADVAYGSTLAGSSLSPTSSVFGFDFPTASGPIGSFSTGSAQSGTWRCMGFYDHTASVGSGANVSGATLWLRIS